MAERKVSVKTLKYHTHKGEAHDVGEFYEVDAQDVDNLVAQGMVAAPPFPPAAPTAEN